MKRFEWMTDEYESARHPWKLSATMFSLIWLVVTPYSYFQWADRNLLVAALVGTGFGLFMSAFVLGKVGQLRGWPTWIAGQGDGALLAPRSESPLRRVVASAWRWHFVILCGAIALALLGLALAARSWSLVVAALPFAGLAGVLRVLRRRR